MTAFMMIPPIWSDTFRSVGSNRKTSLRVIWHICHSNPIVQLAQTALTVQN